MPAGPAFFGYFGLENTVQLLAAAIQALCAVLGSMSQCKLSPQSRYLRSSGSRSCFQSVAGSMRQLCRTISIPPEQQQFQVYLQYKVLRGCVLEVADIRSEFSLG